MDKYEVNWKHYYEILQVSPDADSKVINAAYKRLADLYHHLQSEAPEVSEYCERTSEINEAHQVLSDPIRRAKYDRIFKARCNGAAEVEEPDIAEIADLMRLVAQEVSNGKGRKDWRIPALGKVMRGTILIVVISLLSILVGGTSFAFAQPKHVLATPFKGIAVRLTEASSGAIGLIENIRRVAAAYERNIVSSSLQSMRVIEDLKEVPKVTEPTNDMAYFPSRYHPLFPDYLDRRFSQFKYTVDSNGIVKVDVSGATTDALLDKIGQLLNRLAEGE